MNQIETFLCKTCFIMHDTWHSIKVDTDEKGNPIYQCKLCHRTENLPETAETVRTGK